MKSYEKIVNFVNKKNNVITTKEFKDAKIGFYYINKLIEDNYISRIDYLYNVDSIDQIQLLEEEAQLLTSIFPTSYNWNKLCIHGTIKE